MSKKKLHSLKKDLIAKLLKNGNQHLTMQNCHKPLICKKKKKKATSVKCDKGKHNKMRSSRILIMNQEGPEGDKTCRYKPGSHAANLVLRLSLKFREKAIAPPAPGLPLTLQRTAVWLFLQGTMGSEPPLSPPARKPGFTPGRSEDSWHSEWDSTPTLSLIHHTHMRWSEWTCKELCSPQSLLTNSYSFIHRGRLVLEQAGFPRSACAVLVWKSRPKLPTEPLLLGWSLFPEARNPRDLLVVGPHSSSPPVGGGGGDAGVCG